MPLVLPHKRAILLRLREQGRREILNALPSHQPLVNGWYAFPQTLDTDRVMRNLGIKMEGVSPYRSFYIPPKIGGRYEPRWDQHAVSEFICVERKCFVLNPPRMGKTASSFMAGDYIRQEHRYPPGKGAILIVAPLTTLKDTWMPEIFGMRPGCSFGLLAFCNKKKRLERLAEGHDVYLINPDGVKLIADELFQAVKDGVIAIVVVDEVTEFANTRSERWQALAPICWAAPWAIGMTGTPGDPTYVYGIAKLIRRDNVPKTYKHWRDKTMVQVGGAKSFKWIPSPYAKEEIKKALHPAIRFEKSVLALAQLIETRRRVEMDEQQHKAYEALRKHALIQIEESGGIENVSAANKGVLTSKLIQIACGSVINDKGEPVEFKTESRLAALREEIDKSESKVVIFTPFRATNERLHAYLDHHYGARRVDGDVTGARRQQALDDWRNKADVKVVILHPKTGAFGLELAQADTLIFYGPPLSGLITYQQAKERINSSKQQSLTPTIVHLSSSAAEDHIFRSLITGVGTTKAINDLFSVILSDAT